MKISVWIRRILWALCNSKTTEAELITQIAQLILKQVNPLTSNYFGLPFCAIQLKLSPV